MNSLAHHKGQMCGTVGVEPASITPKDANIQEEGEVASEKRSCLLLHTWCRSLWGRAEYGGACCWAQ